MQSYGHGMDCSFSDTESLASALSTPRSWSLSPPSSPYYSDISETGFANSIDGNKSPKGKQRTRAKPLENAQDFFREIREKRNAFFLAHREIILPLLGEGTSLSKLLQMEDYADSEPTPFQKIEVQPDGLMGRLKPYQLEGVSFLVNLNENGVGGILADEMGLGKTLQTLSLFQFLKESDYRGGTLHAPFLVVCPLSVLDTWMAEITRWTPEMRAVKYHGTPEQRASSKEILKAQKNPKGSAQSTDMVDIVVTTYDTLLSEIIWFSRSFVWRYIVLDEGHRIKNHRSKRAAVLGRLKSEYKLVLSGTPVQNDLGELWSIFHWLYPDVFVSSTEKLFVQAFSLKDGKFDPVFFDNVRKFLGLIMIRRTKETPGIGLNIPPKTELVLSVPLTKMQCSWYMRILTGADEVLVDVAGSSHPPASRSSSSEISDDESSLLMDLDLDLKDSSHTTEKKVYRVTGNILMELRQVGSSSMSLNGQYGADLAQCSIHPYLLTNAIPDPYILGDHVFNNSGKFIALQKLLKHYVEVENTKVIIFSNFEQALNLCEDLVMIMQGTSPAFEYLRLDGRTTSPWRKLMVYLFQNDPSYMIFLLSIRAAGEGLNLTSSSVVIFLDEDWNPQVMKQAESRAHRIGQSRPVRIYKLRSSGTVEEQMSQRLAKKA
ncbi:putative nucleosome remodeling complex ATPase subunit (Snf2h) [Aspergillus clavatus NRRL 1]|uniref:Nucleosome remodeling complex ATPase subunit (Snf2h), putative n=1 Tax=Aspergillus clavatus (strain ATCC 1007 / CBS 513.65 / DSM 816 / NCTC 3887 / NRRL 1 / QM 1276 / 107) TaxID=344612 RepID=A1CB67_ASPCL|nr:nucleosome remodeling complex ATPase subunit (Snf2h), putative [Aspergillus clavatus NRRL 1]EAW12985.1 nucleosome remodeling complex ATPase subunit (Snf2h), putative [Aspergillus clavatus NRRL 1]